MKNKFLIFIAAISFISPAQAFWTDFSLTSGSNEFLRTEGNFASNISTRIVGGIGVSAYKREKQDYVYALRFPLNYFIGRNILLTAKPFFYPADRNGSFAQGARASFSLLTENAQNETSTTYTFAAAHQRQRLAFFGEKDFSSNCAEISAEKNFYDQFFILASAGAVSNSGFSYTVQKNYAETQDLISLNSNSFLNDFVLSKLGLQFARSFKPDFDSYVFAGYDKINGKFSEYNSWLFGLRINFSEKNSANFSYNYLDDKKGHSKKYYKISIGILFK
ncbi:MAG: hypothetical protein GX447_01095 [Elusimicrobia bacterium]|nr:hypothetical protein [Elusimicrobiota bacterium]